MSALLLPRPLYILGAVLVVASMAAALYLQHAIGLAPCPLCVIQRVAYIAAAIFAVLAAWASPGSSVRPALGSAAVITAVAGGGVAGWHVWLLANPNDSLGCGRPFEWFHEDFPLVVWLPKLFRGDGDCLAVEWSFLGLAVPHWSLVAFILLTVVLCLATRRAWLDRARSR